MYKIYVSNIYTCIHIHVCGCVCILQKLSECVNCINCVAVDAIVNNYYGIKERRRNDEFYDVVQDASVLAESYFTSIYFYCSIWQFILLGIVNS